MNAQQLIACVPAWHHRFEIAPGVVTPGAYDPAFLWEKMALPEDLSGKRALDVGPADGFFSLQLKRRGADVVAVDYRPKDAHGFEVMERLSRFTFEYHQANFYDISAARFGTFDIVLFLGVLYHLPDMLRALALLRTVCNGVMFLETHCANDLPFNTALARYYRSDTLNGDVTNFWSPNSACIADMLHDASFDIQRSETWENRYFGVCRPQDFDDRKYKLKLAYGTL